MKSFKTLTFFTMADSKLNHLLVILIYNEEFEEINIKLRTNKPIKEIKRRSPELLLLGCINFEHLLALVYLLSLLD